jgi:hypothetical protein
MSPTIQICEIRYIPSSKRVCLDWEKDDEKSEDQEGSGQIGRESHSAVIIGYAWVDNVDVGVID